MPEETWADALRRQERIHTTKTKKVKKATKRPAK